MESRIKELLKERGLTISNLAEQIGTTSPVRLTRLMVVVKV